MKILLPGLLLLGTLSHLAHRAALEQPRPTPDTLEETLPSEDALRLTSLGYGSLVADYYWLRAISHFGDSAMHEAHYPSLTPFIRRIVSLDPNFAQAYYFAGTALTLSGMAYRDSLEILEQGMKNRPDKWRIAYLAGFNAYHFLHDFERGAKYLALAAKDPESPALTGRLATRVAAHGGSPELGLQMVDEMIRVVGDDEESLIVLAERRKLLLNELHLKWLNQAVARYRERHGVPPMALDELRTSGILSQLPEETMGGEFFVEADGTVNTTSERLRLKPEALNQIEGQGATP